MQHIGIHVYSACTNININYIKLTSRSFHTSMFAFKSEIKNINYRKLENKCLGIDHLTHLFTMTYSWS